MHPRRTTHRPTWWAAALMLLTVVMTACAPRSQPGARSPEATTSPGKGDGAAPRTPWTEPAEAEVGEPLALDDLPALPSEGVAIQLDASLVFVDLDGAVHGHVPGAILGSGRGLQHVPSGLVPISDDEHGSGWIEPSTGAFSPGHSGTPLAEDATALLDPQAGSPDAYVIHGPDGTRREWDRDDRWWLSAGHRAVTWAACPDDAGDRVACPMNGYDLDTGEDLDLDPGCWVADTLADRTQLRVCTDHDAEPRSWLELSPSGEEPRAYELPRPEEQPEEMPTVGHFLSAAMRDGWILAQASMECEVRRAALIDADTAELQPILGERDPLARASLALGWTEDDRAAVLVHDGPCAQEAEPGVWLVDPATDATELVYPLPRDARVEAHLWHPLPGIDLGRAF